MRRYIERNIEDKLASLIIERNKDKIFGISVTVSNGEILVDSI